MKGNWPLLPYKRWYLGFTGYNQQVNSCKCLKIYWPHYNRWGLGWTKWFLDATIILEDLELVVAVLWVGNRDPTIECRVHWKGPSCSWYQNLAKTLMNTFDLTAQLKYGAFFRRGKSKMSALRKTYYLKF